MKWPGPDSDRPLSEKGRLQADGMGRFLARSGFHPDVILSSPKLRALETARIVAAPLDMPVEVDEALGGPLGFGEIERILRSHGNPGTPLLVGHDPDFSELAAALVGAAGVPLRKGCLVRIDLAVPIRPGQGLLRWLLPPELLGMAD